MRILLASSMLLLPGCGEPVNLGSNVRWFADHESGTLIDWTRGDDGGAYAAEPGSLYEVVSDEARSGSYSVKLTAPGNGIDAGAGLYRREIGLPDAYYGAWYFLPRAYQTTSFWTILRFRSAQPADASEAGMELDLNLRSRPDGAIVLEVLHQRQAYLRWPLTLPAPLVPIQRWFHVESRYRSATDETGLLKVWLDGVLVYDIEDRVTALSSEAYFSPCNLTNTTTPTPVELYVDDAMVSASRITPSGAPNLVD